MKRNQFNISVFFNQLDKASIFLFIFIIIGTLFIVISKPKTQSCDETEKSERERKKNNDMIIVGAFMITISLFVLFIFPLIIIRIYFVDR